MFNWSRRPLSPAAGRAAAPAAGSRDLRAATLGGVTALAVMLAAGCGSGARAPATAPGTTPPPALMLAATQAQHPGSTVVHHRTDVLRTDQQMSIRL